MPYAISLAGANAPPEDGELIGWRHVATEDDLEPFEVYAEDVPEGEAAPVWDASEDAPRPPSGSEILARRKAEKVGDIQRAAIEELTPLFTEGHGDREMMLLLAGYIVQILKALNMQADPRLSEVVRIGTRALEKRDAAKSAATLPELEAIQWE